MVTGKNVCTLTLCNVTLTKKRHGPGARPRNNIAVIRRMFLYQGQTKCRYDVNMGSMPITLFKCLIQTSVI